MQSPQLTSSSAYIDQCPDRDAYLFFHKILDLCCDQNLSDDEIAAQSYLFNDLNFCNKFYPSLWPNEFAFQDACRYFIQLVYKVGSEVINPEQLIFALPFSENIKAILQECLSVRQKELFKSLVFKVVTSRVSYLKNYDWNVSVVLSSDKMSVIKKPLLRLNLKLHLPNENSKISQTNSQNASENDEILLAQSPNYVDVNTRSVTYEFTKAELAEFIKTLEDAKSDLIQSVS